MSSRLAPRRVVAAVASLAVVGTFSLTAIAVPAAGADPCAAGSNPIVCENSKAGADPSVWDIRGAGDDSIQGFSTDISVNVGSTVSFKIKTDSRAYTIDIYRTGYYGGLGARYITSVTPSVALPQHQPECVSDATTEVYDCGNWAVSASWSVPSTAVSGVYVAKLTDTATGDDSHITFVVRNDASTSPVVFQTSDPTWQAYNPYGGSDFYQGAANGRAYKISYNRPVVTRGQNDGRDFYFSAEYAMVRFLERNGYDVSYMAGVDSDRAGALIKKHKVFLSVGHDEYWSAAQRANVEAARDAGVNLAFFSGNEVYWHTRYESSVAGTPTSYRTLVSYKETWSNAKIDPSSEWTGTWRDPRFASTAVGAGKPENNLTGTLYMSNFSDLPVTVSSEEGKLRLWRGTSLASLASGTTAALAPHTIGYESNEDLDNGARPPGLIRLSTTTGAVPQYLQDFGNVVDAGTTTHHLTMYKAPSGALVFSSASIQWAWGLDQTHDGDGAAADSRMQQATVNLLADMKAQPASLASGLVTATASTDTTAPSVVISTPAANASVANGASVTVTGTASDVGGRVAGVEVSTDNGTTWHPATGTTSWSYRYFQAGQGTVPIKVRAIDDSANIGGTPASRNVTVACPCSVFGAFVPAVPAADDSGAVELGLRFTSTTSGFATGVRFYKGTGNTGTHSGHLWSVDGQLLGSVTFANESATGWQTAQFATPVPLTGGTSYVVSYTAPAGHYAVESNGFASAGVVQAPLTVAGGFGVPAAGTYGLPGTFPTNSYMASNYYVDVQFNTVDGTPMTIGNSQPLAGSSSVPTGTPISVVLSKPASGTPTLGLTKGGVAVLGASAYTAATRTLTFTPSTALASSTTYVAKVTAVDAQGAGVQGANTWTFTTVAPPQVAGARTLSFYDDSDVPGTLENADPDAVTLGVRFASSVDGVVTGVRFYKGPHNTGVHVGALWAVGSTTPIAQATFVSETAQGWQTVTFPTPIHITRDTEYVASYRTSVGAYSSTAGVFSGVGLQRAPLRTGISSGMYSYADTYPSSTSTASYMVDVVFTQDATTLAVTAQSPLPGEPGAAVGAPVSITFSDSLAAGAVIGLKAGATAVPGASAKSADGRTLTFTPTAALSPSTVYTVTVSGLVSVEGSTLTPQTWTFSTAAVDGCPCTLFGSTTPSTASANDSSSVELGVGFIPQSSGLVAGVRFYKGAGNGGTHTGTLWSSSGVALRTVVFTGESATGWQTAMFASPYEVTPGTTYVISYLAPQGHYAAAPQAFIADKTVGPMVVPAAGNGRYAYGSGGFPTSTWQQTNYFVDVVFSTAPASAPTVAVQAPPDGATGVSPSATVAATLSKAPASGTPVMALTGPSGAVAGTSDYNPSTLTVSFTPSSPLPAGASISVATTLASNALGSGAWTFTVAASAPTGVSLWADSVVPTYPAWNDPAAVQVGTRFTTSVAGTVTAIRFYKGAANTGVHTVNLWGPTNNLLAQAPSTAETGAGWQTVALPTPISLVAGQTYTASYYSTTGMYAVTSGELGSVRTSGPLSTVVPGGAYVYGTGFPSGSSTASYGVDVVFVPSS